MDNAIEATVKLPEKERNIKITLQWDLGNLYLSIENSYNGTLKTNKFGEIKTLKSNQDLHGFGLISVNKCVEKYHGVMEISHDFRIFKVTVLLYSDF